MWYFSVLCVCLSVLSINNAQNLGGFCRTPLGESAKCISVYECTPIISLLRSPSRTEEETQLIAKSKCGFDRAKVPYVCCGTTITTVSKGGDGGDPLDSNYTPNPSIPGRNECGWQSQQRIFNGEQTSLAEFPWMAVLQYLKRNGNRRIACAGSLINQRYVLTAAHCVVGDVLVKVGQLINVRLGEYDTSSPGRDCFTQQGRQFCNQEEINAGIEEIIPHPRYTGEANRMHDIALVRLDRDIPYSDYIQPVCLPLPNEASQTGETLTVSGWGKTEKGRDSNVKLKLQVPLTESNVCSNAFSPLNVRIDRQSQVCAGGEDGKDSCTGDSGGPLMRTLPTDQTRWMIEGLVSFGYNYCGTKGYPGVYTRIARYVPWIHKNVRP